MGNRVFLGVLVAAILIAACQGAFAWSTVGDGIEYQAFTAAGPNNLFVTRMSRTNTNATIDTCIAYDMMAGAREIVRNQAAREDDAITWWGGSWGKRNDVVAAINGGFFNMTTGVIDGGQIKSGWYAHWFPDMGAFSGFAWKTDRTPFVGQCIDHTPAKVYVKFVSNGATQAIDGINRDPGSNDLVIFTPQYDNQTPTGTRTEVVVQMTQPIITTSGSGYSSGTILSETLSTGSTWIPFDCIVLSAAGDEGTTLKNNAVVGGEVRIFQELIEKNQPDVQGNSACQTTTGVNWANVFASINSNYHFLENGVVRVPDAVAHPGYIGYVNLNPRTAICYNADYVFFVVCDGRTSQSVGMSCEQLGNWAKNTLGATDGVNLDGGGSCTMVVNGAVMNHVSDGSERAVCNGVMMVNLAPKVQYSTFFAGQTVTVASAANIRLGLGTNYGLRGTASAGQTGVIQTHSLNGVYAKGYDWWNVNVGGTVGWIGGSLLIGGSSGAPVITQQPSPQSVSAGGTATFTVVASGVGTLSYEWQKNSATLSNGGHYSGVATSTLTVSNCDSSDVASYRCVVSNAYGSTTSDSAALTLGVPPPAPTALPASSIGTDTITWNWSTVSGATGYKLWTAPTGGTQIGGAITNNYYTETGLEAATPYTRYVEAWNACCASTTRTQLGPTQTAIRNCVENGGFENGFQTSGVGNKWIGVHVGTGGTATWSDNTTYRNSGSHSQAINVTGSSAKDSCGYVYQKLNVVPGRTYSLLGYFLASNNSALHGRFGYDPTAGVDPFGPNAIIDDFVPNMTPPFTARPVTVTATAEYLTIFVGGYYSPKTGSANVYVDDISMKPAAPTSTGGTTTISRGQTATITASGGFGGDESELCWYTGPAGTGTRVGTGTSLVVSPTSTITYYPRWETSGQCGISADGAPVTVTVTTPVAPTVTSITPSSGPNTGTTSITNLAGTGFLSGAAVKLKRTGQTDITATGVSVASATKITCSLDLTDKKTGLWDVFVRNTDTLSGTLTNGFGITVPDSLPNVGMTVRSLLDSVMTTASLNTRITVWGKVTLIDSSTFWLNDGSGTSIKVFAPGYTGLANGNYLSATGGVDLSVSPPVLISSPSDVRIYYAQPT